VSTLLATSLYQWLMFLHVLAAMTWLGGLVVLIALSGLLIRTRDRDAIGRFSASLRRIGPLTLAPSTIAVVSLGIGLVLDSDSWRFSQGWIVLALALFAAAFLIGAAFQSRAAILLQRAVDAEDDDLAVRQLRRWAWGMRLILLLLVVATWDMVVKPTL
jgi:uncharacterized membrane protein